MNGKQIQIQKYFFIKTKKIKDKNIKNVYVILIAF